MLSNGEFMNRLIVVTGAGTGIGKATAERFARNSDKVLLIGRRENKLIKAIADIGKKTENTDMDYIALDMSVLQSLHRLRAHIERFDLQISALICCAGSAPTVAGNGDLKMIAQEWHDAYQSNVLTSVLAAEGLEPLMAENGSIVLYSSIAAYRGSGGSGAYGAMKAALHSYAHTLALRLGVRGINVNVIAPGYVAQTDFFGDRLPEARKMELIRQTAMGRPGKPEDAANLGFYLCSDEGAYITSQILQINGGSNHGV